MHRTAFLGLAGALLLAGPANADPCTALSDKGPTPKNLRKGAVFAGEVTYVGDGDSLCVATGPSRRQWVEVRVADFYAPELSSPRGSAAKAALTRIAKGRRAVCKAEKRSYDRVVARCTIGGRSLAALLREAGVVEGGRGRSAEQAAWGPPDASRWRSR